MLLSATLSARRTLIRPPVADRSELLASLLEVAATDGEARARARGALELRSRTGVFGVGRGLAVPHGYVSGWGGTEIAVATLSTPVEFDGRACDVVLFIVSDPTRPHEHNEVLTELAAVLNTPGRLDAVRSARDAAEALAALTGDGVPATPVA